MADGTSPGPGQPGWNPPQHQPPSAPQPSQPQQPPAASPQPQQPPQPPQSTQPSPQQAPQSPYAQQQPPQQPQQPPGAPQGAPQQPQQQAFWARGATSDPWRNPQTNAVVTRTPQPMLPPTEPPLPRTSTGSAKAGIGSMVVVATIAAVLAGFLGAAVAILANGGGGGGQFNDPAGNRELGDYEKMISKTLPSVVTIWVESAEGAGNGSGWVISQEGYIVTNAHVADLAKSGDAEMKAQFSDGSMVDAEVVGTAKSTDIAVLQVKDKEDLQALDVANSDELAVGNPVVAVGAPFGLADTVTDGIVSAVDRPVQAGESETDATVMAGIQTDASINPGNSGGPLLDASGQVVGVNTSIYAIANEQGEGGSIGLGFAIPSNQAKRVAEDIIDDGSADKPVLGAELETTEMGDTGAEVGKVDSKAPAAEAGIEDGDVITKLDDTPIVSDIQLQALVLKHAPDDKVTVTYERDGGESEADVTLGAAEDK